MTPTDEQCDAIVRKAWGLSPDSTSVTPQDRAALRAAFAAGAASVAVPPREPRECQECGTYEHSPAYCATCGFAWKDAAPARQDQSGEVDKIVQRDEGKGHAQDAPEAASPDPTPAPVDKTANPQGSPVDKSPKSQGEPRDDASYATEYADPTPAAEPVIAPSKLVAAIKVQLSAAQVALLSGNKERCYGPLVWLNIYGREAVKRIEDLEEQLRDALRDADILADMAQPDPTPASDDLVAKLLTPIQCKTFANNGWQCLTIDQALSIGKQRKQAAARIVEQDKTLARFCELSTEQTATYREQYARIVEQDKRIAELEQLEESATENLERFRDAGIAAEARLAEATKLLQWLDSKGGLGLDTHERIRAFLKGEK